MNLIECIQSILLGLVEGLTEFLPVSSTGHLIIAGNLLGYTGEQAKTFEIAIQLGAILAVCWHYRVRLIHTIQGLTGDKTSQRFAFNLILAVIPAAVMGLALHGLIKKYLFNPVSVAIALAVGGFIILLVERRERVPRITDIGQLSWQDALKLGFAQVFALFPGTSRSGATIVGGMFAGLSRKAATEFSFFLAMPTMLGAATFDLIRNADVLTQDNMLNIGVGFVAAFISALLVVSALVKFVERHTLRVFAWYRIVLGVILLFVFL